MGSVPNKNAHSLLMRTNKFKTAVQGSGPTMTIMQSNYVDAEHVKLHYGIRPQNIVLYVVDS